MNIYSLASLLASFSCITLALFVFLKDRSKILNRSFTLIATFAGVWTSFPFLISLSESENTALFLARIIYIFAAFVPTTFCYFGLVILNQEKGNKEKYILKLLFLFSLIFATLSFSPNFIQGVLRGQPFFTFIPGKYYIPFMLFFALGCGYTFYRCYKGYLCSSSTKRNQMKYILVAFTFAYIAGFMHFLAAYLRTEPFPHDFLLVLFPAIIAYAIVKHRLMDISVIAKKAWLILMMLLTSIVLVFLVIALSHKANLYSTPPLLAATLIFACGLWILLKNPKAVSNITFSLVCLGISIWLFSSFMLYSSANENEAFFWTKFVDSGVVFIPALFYQFCHSFLKNRGGKWPTVANYLISTIFLIFLPTNYIYNGMYSYYYGYYPKAGPLHPLFLVYFCSASGFSLKKLYQEYRAIELSSPLEATRIKYLFWAFVAGFIASIDFIQTYGFEFYPTGYIFVTLLVIIVTYAISKYQLMDITFIVSRPKILTYMKPLALIPFYFVVLILIRLFTGSYQYLLSGILVASFAIFAGLLVSLQSQMEITVEKSFFRKRYDAYQTLTEFSKAIVSILDLEELIGKITKTLSKGMGVDQVSLFVLDEKSGYSPGSILGLDDKVKRIQLKADDPLPAVLTKRREIIIKEELDRDLFVDENKPLIDNMAAIEAEVSIPFISKGRLVGFCNLGNKKSRGMYSHEDMQLLSNLAQQAAIAIENARLHYLEKKSLILMKQIDKLDTFARFAGGMAHEINNPLVTISTFFQLLPQKRDDEEFMDSFSRLAFSETERIRRLTKELLDYGKPKEIQFRLEDLNILVTRVVLLIKLEAEKKKIAIKSLLATDLPRIHLDPDQIKQVILNMLLNAIEATEHGGSITIITRYIRGDQKDEFIQIEVTDTGVGIPEEEIGKIFDPFFTTKHRSREREGTGLGLSISHQIVKEHNGFINVESVRGKGTTFLIYLPINPMRPGKEGRPLSAISTILDTR